MRDNQEVAVPGGLSLFPSLQETIVMSDYEILDPQFQKLIIWHAKLERLWTGCRWAEGPVYVPAAKHLLWSDIPNDRVMRFDEGDGSVSVFETGRGNQNGHTLDAMGRVVACEQGGRKISRLEHDGSWKVLADRYGGKRLNSPNDVVVRRDGSIWFTDPSYGIEGLLRRLHCPRRDRRFQRLSPGRRIGPRRHRHRHGAAERAGVLT